MSDEQKMNLGIDIGGTKTGIGIVTENGDIINKSKIPSDPNMEPMNFVHNMIEAIHELLRKSFISMEDIHFIGVGVPGTVNTQTGMVSYCPNLQWFDVPLSDYFRQMNLGKEVKIAQDSRNGALAEHLFGAGVGLSDLLCVAIGTGIGCGIILNGKIFNGAMNTAGELGHTPIIKGGRPCVCGNHGCLERYASGSGIVIGAKERLAQKFVGKEITSEAVFSLAESGDLEALAFIEEVVDYLAFGIAKAVTLISPQAVIISGGLCENEALFVDPLQDKVYHYGYYPWVKQNTLKVIKAKLGSDAPLIGASALYRGL